MAKKSKKSKKPLVKKNWGKKAPPEYVKDFVGSDAESVNRLATSVPNPVVPKAPDDHKVRAADLKRSQDQMVELAPHSDEAVLTAGLPLDGYDEKLVGVIAAVSADGATGRVGWVLARKIAAAIKGK